MMVAMNSTSQSLLIRLRESPGKSLDQTAWREFVELYTPLIFGWSRKTGLNSADASDLVQDVVTIVFQKLPGFAHQQQIGSFRGWLKTVTLNRYRETIRKKSAQQIFATHSVLEQFQSVENAESTWDIDYARLLIQRAMLSMKPDFAESTWEALGLVVGRQMSVDAAAEVTGVSLWTIYSAKSRLLKRLRNELEGLM